MWPGGMRRASVTVHCTIMISSAMPSATAAAQTAGSGHGPASARGEIAQAPSAPTPSGRSKRAALLIPPSPLRGGGSG